MEASGDGDTNGQNKQVNKPAAVSRIKAPPLYIAFIIQFFICVMLTLAVWLLLDAVTAYSVLLGGLISIVPNSYFAWKAFRYRGASNTPLIVKSFYAGETGKLIMTGVSFALVFGGVKPLNELAVIVSFIIAIVVGLVTTAWVSMAKR
ncbi:MAG: ATP synthase protein I [Pseudohongiellaceae bacterium]|jgi:ATP synthase protein I|tara:strand:+ start:189 stop:632 length:444 start_codon:yes stop_codon:yes gene_type:complete